MKTEEEYREALAIVAEYESTRHYISLKDATKGDKVRFTSDNRVMNHLTTNKTYDVLDVQDRNPDKDPYSRFTKIMFKIKNDLGKTKWYSVDSVYWWTLIKK
jgi:hypothetical protein